MIGYLLHMRPRSWPIVAAHSAAGFLCGSATAGEGIRWTYMGAAAVVWAVLLNGGTLALNSAFDKDTGPIGYLDNPPPVPSRLALFGLVSMTIGLAASFFISIPYAVAYVVSVIMSVLYSCPPFRLKAVPFRSVPGTRRHREGPGPVCRRLPRAGSRSSQTLSL